MSHVSVCPLFCCRRVNYVWEMGRNTSALLHIGAHIIQAIAPLPLMLLDFSRSSFNDTKWNLRGSEQTLSFDSLIQDFKSVVCCSDAVSAKEEWLLIICWWCRQHDNTNVSAVLILLSHFRSSTPLSEARPKGYTSTTSSWVWYYWPEDAMKRRPSVSPLWWETVLTSEEAAFNVSFKTDTSCTSRHKRNLVSILSVHYVHISAGILEACRYRQNIAIPWETHRNTAPGL